MPRKHHLWHLGGMVHTQACDACSKGPSQNHLELEVVVLSALATTRRANQG